MRAPDFPSRERKPSRSIPDQGFNRYLVPMSFERTGDGSTFPLSSGIGESQDFRVGIVKDAV